MICGGFLSFKAHECPWMKEVLKLFSPRIGVQGFANGVQRFATCHAQGVQRFATGYNLNNIFDKRLYQDVKWCHSVPPHYLNICLVWFALYLNIRFLVCFAVYVRSRINIHYLNIWLVWFALYLNICFFNLFCTLSKKYKYPKDKIISCEELIYVFEEVIYVWKGLLKAM